MTYTTPPTFAATDILAAADLNILGDDIVYLKGQTDALAASAVKLNRTSAQSIPDSTWTAVVWNNQLGDLGGWWSSGTNIVMPSDFPAGVSAYFVDIPMVAVFATNTTGNRGVRLLLNGSVVEQYSVFPPDIAAVNSSIFEVAEGDVITMEVFQSSGGALNLSGVIITCKRLFPSA
jgi:hypothetical protein